MAFQNAVWCIERVAHLPLMAAVHFVTLLRMSASVHEEVAQSYETQRDFDKQGCTHSRSVCKVMFSSDAARSSS